MFKQFHFIGIFLICILNGFAQESTFQKTYGILGYNTGSAVIPIASNNYIIAGNINGYNDNTDIYLAQIDSNGTLIWDKTLGSNQIDFATHMILGYDSTILITGYTNNTTNGDYDILCMATDLKGTVKWTKHMGTTEWDFANKIIISTIDMSYFIVGKTFGNTNGGSDMYILKLKPNGDTIWTKSFGYKGNDIAYDAAIIPNQKLLIAGSIDAKGNDTIHAYIAVLNKTGDLLWEKTYGNNLRNEFKKCILTSNNSIIAVGNTDSIGNIKPFGLVYNLSIDGDSIWSIIFKNCDDLVDIIQFHPDSIALAGYTTRYGGGQEDMLVQSIDLDGVFKKSNTFGGEFTEKVSNFTMTASNGFIICGTSDTWGIGHTNIYIIKTDHNFYFNHAKPPHVLNIQNIDTDSTITIAPNPASNQINISTTKDMYPLQVNIINFLGNVVLSKKINSFTAINTIDISTFANGFYTIILQSNDSIESIKFIIHK